VTPRGEAAWIADGLNYQRRDESVVVGGQCGVTGFWHAGITVSDLDRSLSFYGDALGLELVSR
jgi:hypothetical protein